MASDEVQPVTAQQPIEGELNVLTMSNEQILNLISPTHLPDEENFDADSLLVAVEHERAKCIKNFLINNFQGQKNLEEKVSRLEDNFNPQLLCILKQLSYEMACKAPSVEVIMSILTKLSNYSWEAKLLLILAAYALNFEDFLDIPNNVPATLKHQNRFQEMFRFHSVIDTTLRTMKYFLKVKKVTKDEPSLLSDVAGDIPVVVYWIILTCTTHMCCLNSDEDKTQDLSPLVDKIQSILSDLEMRIRTIEEMLRTRKLKELFPRDAMQPLIDGSTNEQVSIDVLIEKNILLYISGLNIHKNDMSNLMSIYDRIKEEDQYKIVWIPIVEQWTIDLRKKFEMLQSKMPWYIVQYFSAVAAIKFIEERYDNKPIVLLINPQGYVENEDTLYFIQQYAMGAFPFIPPTLTDQHGCLQITPGPHAIKEYTFVCGGKDKRWIEQFSQKVNVLAEDPLLKEVNIIIEFIHPKKNIIIGQQDFDEETQEVLRSLRKERRWAVLIMTNFSEVISKDGTTILQVLEAFEEWKVNVREKGFQNVFEEYHDGLLQTGSQPSASRNV